jgi:cytochrome P450
MQNNPDGPKGYPVIGNLLDLASPNRIDWLQSIATKYGDVSKFKLITDDVYLINHPDLVKEVLTKKSANYTKNTLSFKVVKVVLGESTFTSMGDAWQRKRRLVQPSFQKRRIAALSTAITDTITEMLEEWEIACDKKQTLSAAHEMMQITLKVVVKSLFSTALSKEETQTVANVFTPLLDATNKRVSNPFQWVYKLPLTSNKTYRKFIDELDTIIYRIIRDRRKMTDPPMDLLQMLMDAQDEETGEPLTDEELRDEVMTVFIAGHETTANAMSWLWVLLAKNPEVREKVEAEVAEVLGDRIPTPADFPQLAYSLKVFKETMRLYPPVPILPRRAEEDDMLGGYFIKGGNRILFSPYLLHRHPDFWENPEVFDPHRFDKEAEIKQHSFAYLPFGGGSRICIGNHFAMMEAIFITAMVTQRFKIHIPDTNVEPLISLTTRPKGGVPFQLERR